MSSIHLSLFFFLIHASVAKFPTHGVSLDPETTSSVEALGIHPWYRHLCD